MKGKKNKQKYLSFLADTFLKSFKISIKKLSFIVIIDMIFYLLLILSFMASSLYVENKSKILEPYDLQNIVQSQNAALADKASSAINSYITSLIAVNLIWFLLFIVFHTIAAYLIWFKISGHKKSTRGFFKFLLINAVLIPLTLVVLFLYLSLSAVIFSSFNQETISYLIFSSLFIFFIPFFTPLFIGMIFYSSYSRNNEFVASIKDFFIVMKKLHKLFIPGIIAIVLFSIISLIVSFFGESSIYVFLPLMLIYLAWLRNYWHVLVENTLNSK